MYIRLLLMFISARKSFLAITITAAMLIGTGYWTSNAITCGEYETSVECAQRARDLVNR